MSSPTRWVRFAAVLSVLALAGCTAMNVNSYLERGADFTKYRTYAWGAAPAEATGDPRLDNNPFFHDRVRADADKQLATRGFQKIASGTPDLVLHYHASVSQKLEVSGTDNETGACRGDSCRPFVYDAGTLLFDFIDGRTNSLVWRGWAEGSVDGVIDNQAWLEQKIADAVDRIMRRLPRRL